MGRLDEYLSANATPLLWAGEQISLHGHVRRKRSGENTYREWLVAATNHRLLFFSAKETMTLAIEPGGWGNPFYVQLKDLSDVAIGPVPGITTMRAMSLGPIEGRGPRTMEGAFIGRGDVPDDSALGSLSRYDYRLTLHIPASTNGIDGQAQFHGSYPEWLQQQVATRALWGQEEYAAEQAAAAAAQAKAEEKRQQQQLARERRQAAAGKAKPYILPVVLGVVALGALGLGILLMADPIESQMRRGSSPPGTSLSDIVKLDEADLKWAKAKGTPPDDCPEKERKLPYRTNRCHGCYVYKATDSPSEADGHRVFKKGNEKWQCPPVEEYEERLARSKQDLADAEENAAESRIELISGAAIALFGLLGGTGAIIWLLRVRKRRAAEPSQAAGA
ncbi:MAG: hypothetical protein JRI23_28810 [Deltaproteobacteria bacterium]|jgi:hypothetical protein|nr:hypothetical protein [Deltaproteobacteria bacterium]MBW2536120.1 hypothetical protein [Deltaproteobacteria bacterium]